jgi:6-phosphogluconolactonase
VKTALAGCVMVCCACDLGRVSPSMKRDAGPGDAGYVFEAPDGGQMIDPGTAPDAGVFDLDAGPLPQADAGGLPTDAGSSLDAGMMPQDAVTHVYVGTANLVAHYLLSSGGRLTFEDDEMSSGPSYLAFYPSSRGAFSVNDTIGKLSSYSVSANGALKLLNQVSSSGAGPTHLAVDGTGRFVMAANYSGGQTPVVQVNADGSLGANSDLKTPGVKPHLVVFSPNNKFVFVPCLGSDAIAQFLFDEKSGVLTANTPATVATARGAGPRHAAISRDGTRLYVLNELNSTLSSYSISTLGRLQGLDTKSSLPAGFAGNNSGAHIVLHPNQELVFVSNRGHDSIATFRIAVDGSLTLVGHTSTTGATPRDFGISPDGAYLLVANQTSGSIVTFRVNVDTGSLNPVSTLSGLNSPAFVGAVQWP